MLGGMSNKFNIPADVEERIRARDTLCVYCRKVMAQPPHLGALRDDWATIEHLDDRGSLNAEENLAICCWGCNVSKGPQPLPIWFQMPYCTQRGINEETVAEPVKEFLKRKRLMVQ